MNHVAGLEGIFNDDARALLLDRVGRCQASLGQFSAAEIAHRQALSTLEKIPEIEDRLMLSSMNKIGNALIGQGKYEEAETMHRQTRAISEKVLGAEHPDTLTSMNNLAGVLNRQGKYEEADIPTEGAVWGWWSRLQDKHLTDLRGVFYTTTSKKEMTGLESEGQLDLFVKRRDAPSSDSHEWANVRVIGEHTVSTKSG